MSGEISRIALNLHRRLGPKILAQILREPRLRGVEEMTTGQKIPTPDQQKVLRQMDAISGLFPYSPSPRAIRTWLEGAKEELGNGTPIDALREGNFEQVFDLAWTFNRPNKSNRPQ